MGVGGYTDYVRTCKRCQKFYRTVARTSKICDECKLKNGYKKKVENDEV